ncbi:MAG: hypothetical protein COA96_06670 [SAR86 cluster bacterium]|uniref:DUF3379 domain-containing protein n=1 Tax=SAR86 cluster bacterium TaxID=2030880 RepID=A0A2A5B2Y1_9GAMM|nr:MAG: hypothetical protein COA96_06670 [SAR86 cluster bacterium]
MDELEFRKRVYANPNDLDQETLDAARDNSALQEILEQTQMLDAAVDSITNTVDVPAGLKEKLMAIPASADSSIVAENNVTSINSGKLRFFQYYAMAACLLLAVGVTFSLTAKRDSFSGDVAFSDDIFAHLYEDHGEMDYIVAGIFDGIVTIPAINETMSNAGARLVSNTFTQALAIRSARPCIILPAYESAHLMLEGTQGAISVFVINNSPVSSEFSINDDRFNGVVIPMGDGNMILVGEKNENLDQYKALFSQNVEWII